MVYNLMKRMIDSAKKNGTLEEKKAGFIEKINAFYLNGQMTTAEYNELMAEINPKQDEAEGKGE